MSADDDLRRAKCASKIAYESAGAARAVSQHITRPGRHCQGPKPTAYRCPFCGKFHLGRDYTSHRAKLKN